jgi:hypothetical protein
MSFTFSSCVDEHGMNEHECSLTDGLRLLVERCPRLARACYWAGTSSISIEELEHRESFDIDLHTRRALVDVRPLLTEIRRAFPDSFEVVQDAGGGMGFSGVLTLPGGARVTVEVLSNHEDVPSRDLAPSTIVPEIKRVTLARYLADKVQCVTERNEARDLVDIRAVLARRPDLERRARLAVEAQDALLMAERLTAWTDLAIENDLRAYPDARPEDARWARDRILSWLRPGSTGE